MTAAPPAGTWARCDTCGMALVHKNATLGWRHALHGTGTDHDPAPHGWDYEASPAMAAPAPVEELIDALEASLAVAKKEAAKAKPKAAAKRAKKASAK